jgi:hypothetical protein
MVAQISRHLNGIFLAFTARLAGGIMIWVQLLSTPFCYFAKKLRNVRQNRCLSKKKHQISDKTKLLTVFIIKKSPVFKHNMGILPVGS